ncbi:MAG: hypothetical protein AB1714_00180 [Acidobacteriota bacterium]
MWVIAGLALLLAVLVPGFLLFRCFGQEEAARKPRGELLFAVLAAGLYLASWIGILLVEIGRFTPVWMSGTLAALSLILWLGARRASSPLAGGPRAGGWLSGLPLLLLLALLPLYRPFEYILGGRDPGVYVNAGIMVSRTGGIPFRDPLIDELPAEVRGLFLRDVPSYGVTTTERIQGYWYPGKSAGGIVSQGLHLFPAWLGAGRWLFGYPGLLWMIPVIALFGCAGIYYFCSSVASWQASAVATVLLLMSPIQIYFSKYPSSEVLVLALLWPALYFYQCFTETSSPLYAALAGCGLGLTLMTRLDSVLLIVPVCLVTAYALIRFPERKGSYLFTLFFGLLAVHATVHMLCASRPYVLAVINVLKIIPLLAEVALPGFVILLLLTYLARNRLRALLVRSESSWVSWPLPLVAAAAAAYLYFYRPFHPGGHWDLGNANSLRYFEFYMGSFATLAVVIGFMHFIYSEKGRNVLFTFVVLTCFGFYFYRLQIYPELIWAMRRFVPVVWPASFVLLAMLLARLWRAERRLRWPARVTAAAAGMVILGNSLTVAPFYFKLREYDGAIAWVERAAGRIGESDLVIFEPRFFGTLQTLSLPLWSEYRRNVLHLVFDRPQPRAFESFVQQWKRRHGGRILIALQSGIEIASNALRPRLICEEKTSLPMLEQLYNGYPRKVVPFPVPYKLYELEIGPRNDLRQTIDIGSPGDDLLVSGCYGAERGDAETFRWTTYKAGIYLPAFTERCSQVEIRLAAGPRPEYLGGVACVMRIGDYPAGTIRPQPGFATFTLAVPAEAREMSRQGRPTSLTMFILHPFTPSTHIRGNTDSRSLGVAIDSVRVIEGQ